MMCIQKYENIQSYITKHFLALLNNDIIIALNLIGKTSDINIGVA